MTLSATATILVICGAFLLIVSIIGIVIIKALPSSWFRNAKFHSNSDNDSSTISTTSLLASDRFYASNINHNS